MSSRLSKPNELRIATREQAEAAMGELAVATHRRNEIAAKMEQELAAVRARFADDLDACDFIVAGINADLHAWARENRAKEFADRQSIELTHGTLGFRIGMPALSLLRGQTWDKVLENLSLLRLGKYIREILEPNKEAIIADADKLGAEQLEAIGVKVRQLERFFVDPRTEPETKGAAA